MAQMDELTKRHWIESVAAELNGFVPRFGVPAETTVAEARSAGLEPVVVADPALALDVDLPEDYELLLASV